MKKKYDNHNERFKVYAEKHKDELLERSREWNKNNRQKRNAVSKAWRERNKEQFKEIKKKYVLNNKEKIKQYNNSIKEKRYKQQAIWRKSNKEKVAATLKASQIKGKERIKLYNEKNKHRTAERMRKWRKLNKERAASALKRYRLKHPEKDLESKFKRANRIKKGIIVKFTGKQLKERLSVFGGKCWMCGGAADQIDHVIPLAKGGHHVLSNLRPACATCNNKKGSKMFKKAI